MEALVIILGIINIALGILIFVLILKRGSVSLSQAELDKIAGSQAREIAKLGAMLSSSNEATSKHSLDLLSLKLEGYEKSTQDRLNTIDKTIEKALYELRRENSERLDGIQKAVDERLQKTIDERLKSSFESVIAQIGNVNKAIGEIKSIANDVGSLKNVLSNVKTKGITGEVLLGGIISEILTPEQYDTNVATKKSSRDVVEFAIKIPSDDGFIYLPVDSKFPLIPFNKLRDAIDTGDKAQIEIARKELRTQIRTEAKTIASKYIDVPSTTDFAIMFLPTESLYIEAIQMGLFEECQREYRVNIAGPTTLSAMVNALRLGFNSVEIQKRSGEVFKLLGVVRTEFEKFATALSNTQKRFKQVDSELEELVGKRTRIMQKRLEAISGLAPESESEIDA